MSAAIVSPRLARGVIAQVGAGASDQVLTFQYNPDSITRRIEPRFAGGSPNDAPAGFAGPPRETISMTIEIDATLGLEAADESVAEYGVLPWLAAFELLVYPKLADSRRVLAELSAGRIQIVAPEAPIPVLVLGDRRRMPVRVTAMSITEEAFDGMLRPIRARIELSFQVLSYFDTPESSPGRQLGLSYHADKESHAARGRR